MRSAVAILGALLTATLVLPQTGIAQPAGPKTFELELTRGALPAAQRLLRVAQGEVVRLRMTSDSAGVLHLHGYRLEARLAPGEPARLEFTARATGRYRLEWHPEGEPAKAGGHHGPPLATLEVRPR